MSEPEPESKAAVAFSEAESGALCEVSIGGTPAVASVKLHVEEKDEEGGGALLPSVLGPRRLWDLVFEVGIGGSCLVLRDRNPHVRRLAEWRELASGEHGIQLALTATGDVAVTPGFVGPRADDALAVRLPHKAIGDRLNAALDVAEREGLPFLDRRRTRARPPRTKTGTACGAT